MRYKPKYPELRIAASSLIIAGRKSALLTLSSHVNCSWHMFAGADFHMLFLSKKARDFYF